MNDEILGVFVQMSGHTSIGNRSSTETHLRGSRIVEYRATIDARNCFKPGSDGTAAIVSQPVKGEAGRD